MCYLKVLDFYKGKNVLLLQGPKGPLFWRLKKDLEKAGANVYKINFSGGDWIFYPFQCINYRGKNEDFGKFLDKFLQEKKIDIVLLFSDSRPIHREAFKTLKEKDIIIGVMEEGYVRPNYITIEPEGVNGYSLLIKEDFKIDNLNFPEIDEENIIPTKSPFWYEVLWSIIYIGFSNILKPFFPYYKHHKSLYFPNIFFKEGIPFLKSGLKKYYFKFSERKIKERIYSELRNKYYLVPLQVHKDTQIVFHSPFDDIKDFIELVIKSFSKNAPEDTYLVFKHHPRDRGYRNYKKFIQELSEKTGVKDRVLYIHDAHLPTLLDNSIGVVVINSSVGMQSLVHWKPTIALGKAIYNQKGITYPGKLDDFWKDAKTFRMDTESFKKLRNFVIFYSQINGSLYRKVNPETNTGFVWEKTDLKECTGVAKVIGGLNGKKIKIK